MNIPQPLECPEECPLIALREQEDGSDTSIMTQLDEAGFGHSGQL